MYKINLIALTTLSMLVVITSSHAVSPKIDYDISKASSYFDDFIKKYNKVYKDDADRELHYQAFVKNLQAINEMNQKSSSAHFEINQFADYTEQEKGQMNGLKLPVCME